MTLFQAILFHSYIPPLHQFANYLDFQFVLLQLMFLTKIITYWSHQTSWILTSYQLQMVQELIRKLFNHHRFNGDFPPLPPKKKPKEKLQNNILPFAHSFECAFTHVFALFEYV